MNPNSLAEIAAMAEYLREEYPGLDDVTFSDTLEGETNIGKIVGALIRAEAEAKEHAEACANLADQYHDMALANGQRQDRARADLRRLLSIAGLDKFKHAYGSVTVLAPRPSLVVAVDKLPDDVCRFKREPDKTEIRRRLDAGEDVPGAALVPGEASVMIRRAK